MDVLDQILDTDLPQVSPLPRSTVQRILEEKRKSKDPCNYDTWARLVKSLGAGHFSSTRELCVPKHKCKDYIAVKTLVLTERNIKVYQNDTRTLRFLDKYADFPLSPKLFDNFECNCNPLKPLKVGVEIMEYFPINLRSYVQKHPKLPFSWWKQIFAQIISILDNLERLKISHNDLNSENIMLFKVSKTEPIIKLIDFGSASSSNKNLHLHSNLPTIFGLSSKGFETGRDLLNFCEDLLAYLPNKLPPKIKEFCEQIETLDIRGTRISINDLLST